MDNVYDTLRAAIVQAKEMDRAIEAQSNVLADLLEGRLRKVSTYRLKRLKAQLHNFNAHTGQWKE